MTRTLEWLWDAVAGPVLHQLGIIGPPGEDDPWPRLCWCGLFGEVSGVGWIAWPGSRG